MQSLSLDSMQEFDDSLADCKSRIRVTLQGLSARLRDDAEVPQELRDLQAILRKDEFFLVQLHNLAVMLKQRNNDLEKICQEQQQLRSSLQSQHQAQTTSAEKAKMLEEEAKAKVAELTSLVQAWSGNETPLQAFRQMGTQLESAISKLTTTENLLISAKEGYSDCTARLQSTEQSHQALEGEVGSLRDKLKSQEVDIGIVAGLAASVDFLSDKIDDNMITLSTRSEEAQQQLAVANRDIELYKSKIEMHHGQIAVGASALAAVKRDIQSLEAQLEHSAQREQSRIRNLTNVQAKLEVVTKERDTALQTIQTQEQKLVDVERQLEAMRAERDSVLRDSQTQGQELTTAHARMQSLVTARDAALEKVQSQEQELTAAQNKITTLTTEKDAVEKTSQDQKEKLAEADTAILALTREKETASQKILSQEKELTTARAKIMTCETEKDAALQVSQSQENMLADRAATIKALSSERDAASEKTQIQERALTDAWSEISKLTKDLEAASHRIEAETKRRTEAESKARSFDQTEGAANLLDVKLRALIDAGIEDQNLKETVSEQKATLEQVRAELSRSEEVIRQYRLHSEKLSSNISMISAVLQKPYMICSDPSLNEDLDKKLVDIVTCLNTLTLQEADIEQSSKSTQTDIAFHPAPRHPSQSPSLTKRRSGNLALETSEPDVPENQWQRSPWNVCCREWFSRLGCFVPEAADQDLELAYSLIVAKLSISSEGYQKFQSYKSQSSRSPAHQWTCLAAICAGYKLRPLKKDKACQGCQDSGETYCVQVCCKRLLVDDLINHHLFRWSYVKGGSIAIIVWHKYLNRSLDSSKTHQ